MLISYISYMYYESPIERAMRYPSYLESEKILAPLPFEGTSLIVEDRNFVWINSGLGVREWARSGSNPSRWAIVLLARSNKASKFCTV